MKAENFRVCHHMSHNKGVGLFSTLFLRSYVLDNNENSVMFCIFETNWSHKNVNSLKKSEKLFTDACLNENR